MKPWFIHKYKPKLTEKQDEFIDLFMKEAKNLEKTYVEEHDEVQNKVSYMQRTMSVQSVLNKFENIRTKSFRAGNHDSMQFQAEYQAARVPAASGYSPNVVHNPQTRNSIKPEEPS